MTAEQKVTSRRMEFVRAIVRNLARQRSKNENWYLPHESVRMVKKLVRQQFGKREGAR